MSVRPRGLSQLTLESRADGVFIPFWRAGVPVARVAVVSVTLRLAVGLLTRRNTA